MFEIVNSIIVGAGWLIALLFVLLFLVNLSPILTARKLVKALRDTGDELADVLKLVQTGNVSIKALLEVIDREQLIAKNEDIMGQPATPEVKARSLAALQNAVKNNK